MRLLLAVVATLALAPAAAANTWTPQTVPPKLANTGRMAAVSCVGSTACMAVGAGMSPTGRQRALAQVWNGSSWAAKTVPAPAGATSTRLAAVSCTAANACTAVGSYALPPGTDGGSRDQNPLVVRWDGTAWTRQSVPLPAGTVKAYFNGVSCTAAGGCKAVGGYRSGSVKSGTLVEHWNGTAWAVRPSPNPAGATFSSLNGVSCTGSICVAVGGFTDAPGGVANKAFAAHYNGSAWSLRAVSVPAGSRVAHLNGVSCTSATACTAVGGHSLTDYQFADTPLAMGWNGTTWTDQPTPARPQSVQRRELTSVSCSSSTKCTAVGPEMDTSPTGGAPLVERWNGTGWTVQPAPKPAANGILMAWFAGVSCNSGGCTAVGGSSAFGDSGEEATPLAERQTAAGTTWAIQSMASVTGAVRTGLMDVDCADATTCVGVGSSFTSRDAGPVLVHWNGTSWVQKPGGAAFASGRSGDTLGGVSCPAANACMAVGQYQAPKADDPRFDIARPEARRWNGTSWTATKLPIPADAAWHVNVTDVDCASATSCVAVGAYDLNNTRAPLIEHFNGTSWTIKPVPKPAGAVRVTLKAVSCTASNACTAVGGYATDPSRLSDKPLAVRWNGTAWSLQTAASPEGAQFAELNGVSCTPPKPCTAVGAYSTTDPYWGQTPLAERWNGTSWALQPAGSYALADVSCPTLTSCTAVAGGDGTTGLAMGWDGASWTNKGYMPGFYNGVSCTAATACTAVGSLLRQELVTRVVFAGLVIVNRGSGPSAVRYSTAPGARSASAPNDAVELIAAG